jgi:hypothetical protein
VTSPAEQSFIDELEGFRREASAVSQFVLSYLSIHSIAAGNASVRRALNRHPLFWNTALAAFQQAGIVALGRIFDQTSPHNIDALLRNAERSRHIFDKSFLASRKQGLAANAPQWLPAYLLDVHVPKQADFRRLRKMVAKHRRIYDAQFRDIRNKIFAHRQVSDDAATAALFSKAKLRDLQKLSRFLNQLHEAMWHAFNNGRRPALMPMPYSAKNLVRRRLDNLRTGRGPELIVKQVKGVIRDLAQPVASKPRKRGQ